MLLRLVDETTVEVTTSDDYRFKPQDYPVVYRQFVEFYKDKIPIKTIRYESDDLMLLQIIVVQHLVEADIASIRADRVDIYQRQPNLKKFGLLSVFNPKKSSSMVVMHHGSEETYFSFDIFGGRNDEYTIRPPVLYGNVIDVWSVYISEYNICSFDSYARELVKIYEENPNAVFRCILKNPYEIPLLCAVLTIDCAHIDFEHDLNTLQLLENVRLKTLNLSITESYAIHGIVPYDISGCFGSECKIENFIFNTKYNVLSPGILSEFLKTSVNRKRIRLNLNKTYDETCSKLLQCLFQPRNLDLTTIVIKSTGADAFDQDAFICVTNFMKQLCDFHIQGRQNVCSLIWRDSWSFIQREDVYNIVKEMHNTSDRRSAMIDCMWDKYQLVYHTVRSENGTYILPNGQILKPDTDIELIRVWNVYDTLEDMSYPVIQTKERFKAIVDKQFGDTNLSLGTIFFYLCKYWDTVTLRVTYRVAAPDPSKLRRFFLEHVTQVNVIEEDVVKVKLTDEFFVRKLGDFFYTKDKLNLLIRIVATKNPALMEPFTTGFGDAFARHVISLLK